MGAVQLKNIYDRTLYCRVPDISCKSFLIILEVRRPVIPALAGIQRTFFWTPHLRGSDINFVTYL